MSATAYLASPFPRLGLAHRAWNLFPLEREALMALRLFCDAAEREAATVELARRVIADIEKAERSS